MFTSSSWKKTETINLKIHFSRYSSMTQVPYTWHMWVTQHKCCCQCPWFEIDIDWHVRRIWENIVPWAWHVHSVMYSRRHTAASTATMTNVCHTADTNHTHIIHPTHTISITHTRHTWCDSAKCSCCIDRMWMVVLCVMLLLCCILCVSCCPTPGNGTRNNCVILQQIMRPNTQRNDLSWMISEVDVDLNDDWCCVAIKSNNHYIVDDHFQFSAV